MADDSIPQSENKNERKPAEPESKGRARSASAEGLSAIEQALLPSKPAPRVAPVPSSAKPAASATKVASSAPRPKPVPVPAAPEAAAAPQPARRTRREPTRRPDDVGARKDADARKLDTHALALIGAVGSMLAVLVALAVAFWLLRR
jgi:hypothetical protein